MPVVEDPNDPSADARLRLAPFAVALVGVAVFVAIRIALRPVLGRDPPMLLLTVPVAIAGYVGGLWPGLVATGAAMLAGTFFLLEHEGSLWLTRPTDRARLVLFAVTGSIISGLSEAMRRASRRAERAAAAADASDASARRVREEQGQAAVALHESEENFRLLVQGVQDYAIFMVNPDGRIATWNEGARRVKGYTAIEAVGQPISMFYEPDDSAKGIPGRNLRYAVEHGVYEGQGWRLRKDGSRFFADVAITALRDRAGTLRGFAKITRDITDRRAAEEALRASEAQYRHLAETLEHRVEERTAQLEEANQQLEAFAYSVSHDLRAPLRAVQGFAQALLEDYGERLDEMGREYAQRAVGAAADMDRLIRDLLEYSRLGRTEFPLSDLSLAQVVRTVTAQMDGELASQGATVEVEAADCQVRANAAVLGQVLSNLLGNATKFNKPGEAARVRLACRRQGDGFVRVSVSDNGIGIAPEHHGRIFNVFERLHGGEAYPGTGIGLAIVRRGVERLGGRCGVESEVGRGSTFWVDLPVAGEEAPARPTANPASERAP